MFLFKILKGIGKRLIRDMLRYGSVWLLVVIVLGIHFSGILKLQFIDHLFSDDTAVGQLGQTISDTVSKNSVPVAIAEHKVTTIQLDEKSIDKEGITSLEMEDETLSTQSNDIKEDVLLIYEDGEYRSYSE